MKIDIEDLSAVKKKLLVTFPKETVEDGLRKELQKIGREAKVRGFRPGKAPFAMIEKIYMPEAMKRYSERAIKESLQSIVAEREMDIATRPTIEKEDFTDEGFVYHAIVEVHPKFELKNYKGLTFKKKKAAVSDDDVAARIAEIKKGHQTFEEKAAGEPATMDDVVTIAVRKYILDGKEMGTSPSEEIDLSRQTVFSEIRSALAGLKAGDEKEFAVRYPDDVEDEKLRGKEAQFAVTVNAVRRKIQPSDDEMAEKLGHGSADAMKDTVRAELATARQKGEDESFKRAMFDTLAAENPFEVPEGMIEELAVKMAEDFARNLERAGVDLEKLNFDWKVVFENNKKEAEITLKRHYLMKAIKETENIDVTDEEIEERVGTIIEGAPDREKAAMYFQNPSTRRNVHMDLLERKIVDFIAASGTVTEE